MATKKKKLPPGIDGFPDGENPEPNQPRTGLVNLPSGLTIRKGFVKKPPRLGDGIDPLPKGEKPEPRDPGIPDPHPKGEDTEYPITPLPKGETPENPITPLPKGEGRQYPDNITPHPRGEKPVPKRNLPPGIDSGFAQKANTYELGTNDKPVQTPNDPRIQNSGVASGGGTGNGQILPPDNIRPPTGPVNSSMPGTKDTVPQSMPTPNGFDRSAVMGNGANKGQGEGGDGGWPIRDRINPIKPVDPIKPPIKPPSLNDGITPLPKGEKPENPINPIDPNKPPDTQIVPGTPKTPNQMNVTDFAGQIVADPNKFFRKDDPKTPENESMKLSDHRKSWEMTGDEKGTNVDPRDPRYAEQGQVQTDLAQGNAVGAQQVDPRQAATYNAQTTQENIAQNGQMQGAKGTLSQGSKVDPALLDMQGSATGRNADGSVNYTGKALNDYAKQNISRIIDTSTPSGRALAEQLGDGNYTDSKATLQGQLATLQSQFSGPNGEPKIPAWAAGTARNVAKIAAFKGMTGTAATAAMSQAIMEASIPIAQQDAQFFQTLTIKNLDNKQESIINKANVLSKFDLTNIDSRMTAAVENSKAFLQMDMANLSNEQQARVINQQARVQSILEDAKAVNTQRLFNAESENDMNKFYDNLNTSIAQFNASQANNMTLNNMSEFNKMAQFDSELNNQREQFYKNMQYNIDISNAKWRQSVTLENSQKAFEAAGTDVKNMVGIASEQLNQLWDRSDSLLDYVWQSAEKAADRQSLIAIEKLKSKLALDAEDKKGWGSLIGNLIGDVAPKILDWFKL